MSLTNKINIFRGQLHDESLFLLKNQFEIDVRRKLKIKLLFPTNYYRSIMSKNGVRLFLPSKNNNILLVRLKDSTVLTTILSNPDILISLVTINQQPTIKLILSKE